MTALLVLLVSPALAGDPAIHEHMAEHLAATTKARDAVIKGDFEAARIQLRALAEHAPAKGLPADKLRFVEAMQAAAKKGGDAANLEEVGAAVGQVSLQCGACHQSIGKGPKFESLTLPKEGDNVSEHMQRHAWASTRMWEGLVQPSRERWDAGALHLLEEPWVKGEPDNPQVDPEVARFAERVHRAGMDALMTWSDSERASLYGGLIATCARCHKAIDDGSARPEAKPQSRD